MRPAFDQEVHAPAAGVAVGVARDLRDRGGDARLVLRVEAEALGDLSRALARGDDVMLVFDGDGQHRAVHARASLATSTVTSSRPRLKSR